MEGGDFEDEGVGEDYFLFSYFYLGRKETGEGEETKFTLLERKSFLMDFFGYGFLQGVIDERLQDVVVMKGEAEGRI